MRTYKEIEELIKKYDEGDDFTGGVSDEIIKDVEKQLNLNLPEQYKWFLSKYGYGGVVGINIFGVGKTSDYPVVIETNRMLKSPHFDKDWIAIESCDEYFYCLSTKDGKVRDWDFRGETYYEIDSFLDYLYTRIKDMANEDDIIYIGQWHLKKYQKR